MGGRDCHRPPFLAMHFETEVIICFTCGAICSGLLMWLIVEIWK